MFSFLFVFFFFNDTATTEIYTLSLHDALPISGKRGRSGRSPGGPRGLPPLYGGRDPRGPGGAKPSLARRPAARDRPAADQQRRGRDELRPVRAEPAAARVRCCAAARSCPRDPPRAAAGE